MTNVEKVGRDLHITPFEGSDPFVIRPLPGRAGIQITDTFLGISGGDNNRAQEWSDAMLMAVDGARFDHETDRWHPLPESEQVNFNRIGMELAQDESEAIIMPAFFWQTILGLDGVKAYLEGGEGLAGTLKATGALSRRLGLLLQQTSPSSASAARTSGASTPSTSTRPGGASNAKQPQDRQPKKPKKRKG